MASGRSKIEGRSALREEKNADDQNFRQFTFPDSWLWLMKLRTLTQGMTSMVYFDFYIFSAKLFCQNSKRQFHFQQRIQKYVWLKVVFEKLFILHCVALTVSVHGGSK